MEASSSLTSGLLADDLEGDGKLGGPVVRENTSPMPLTAGLCLIS